MKVIKKKISRIYSWLAQHSIFLLSVVGVTALLWTIFPSGSEICVMSKCGYHFWGAHEHDAFWHFALVNYTFENQLRLPNFTGAVLSGYNYLLDLLLFTLQKIGLPAPVVYFKIIPVIWSILFLKLLLVVGRVLDKRRSYTFFLIFLSFFGSSFSFILLLWHKQTIFGASSIGSMQSILTLTNIQYALSLLCVLAMMKLMLSSINTYKQASMAAFLVFVAFGLKFYGGFALSIMVGGFYLYKAFQDRKPKYIAFLFEAACLALLSVLIFYRPSATASTGLPFSFSVFSLAKPMLEDKSLFYSQNITLARYSLEASGKIGLKLISIYLFSLVLFVFINFGTRILGLVTIVQKIFTKKFNAFDAGTLSAAMACFLMAMFFVQKGEWWNIIQFLFYTLFLLNFYTASVLSSLFEKRNLFSLATVGLILLLNIPYNADVMRFFMGPSTSYVSREEQAALTFLKQKTSPSAVIFVPVRERKLPNQQKPTILAESVDSSYVTAFSGRQTYLNDLAQLRLIGVNFAERLDSTQKKPCALFKVIDYYYDFKDYPLISPQLTISCPKVRLKKVYTNSAVNIYRNIK